MNYDTFPPLKASPNTTEAENYSVFESSISIVSPPPGVCTALAEPAYTYRVNGKTTAYNGDMGGLTSSSLKIVFFSGIAVTSIIWFLLINGLKSSSYMSPELKETINENTWYILGGGTLVFSLVMTLLSALKISVLKFVVLLGTFALAMAFAGNDLVNFVGVPLTGLEAYQDYVAISNSTCHLPTCTQQLEENDESRVEGRKPLYTDIKK